PSALQRSGDALASATPRMTETRPYARLRRRSRRSITDSGRVGAAPALEPEQPHPLLDPQPPELQPRERGAAVAIMALRFTRLSDCRGASADAFIRRRERLRSRSR